MRIAHVTDFYLPRLGGIEWQVHDLASRHHESGHDVDVITSAQQRPARTAPHADPSVESAGPRVLRVTPGSWFPPVLHPCGPAGARAQVRTGGYDLVHVHAGLVSPLAFGAAHAAARAGIPTVVTAHSLLSYLQPAFGALDHGVRWSRWPVTWTAVSEVAARPLRRLLGPDVPVSVLPNGLDPGAWQVDRIDREPDDVLVVAVMRLAARKRPMPLLRMLRRMRTRVPAGTQVRVVIAGEGPERATMERYLRRHDMTGWVSLPGRFTREQIRLLYARADMFVAPATLESFGIAAMEARSAGLPVVACAQGGVAELIRDGVEGLLARDDDAMVSALVRLAAHPEQREAIAAHNRATAPPVAWTDVLRLTDEVYGRATARPLVAGTVA